MASEAACNKHELTPLARVTGYGIAGIFELMFALLFEVNVCDVCSHLVDGIA